MHAAAAAGPGVIGVAAVQSSTRTQEPPGWADEPHITEKER